MPITSPCKRAKEEKVTDRSVRNVPKQNLSHPKTERGRTEEDDKAKANGEFKTSKRKKQKGGAEPHNASSASSHSHDGSEMRMGRDLPSFHQRTTVYGTRKAADRPVGTRKQDETATVDGKAVARAADHSRSGGRLVGGEPQHGSGVFLPTRTQRKKILIPLIFHDIVP